MVWGEKKSAEGNPDCMFPCRRYALAWGGRGSDSINLNYSVRGNDTDP